MTNLELANAQIDHQAQQIELLKLSLNLKDELIQELLESIELYSKEYATMQIEKAKLL